MALGSAYINWDIGGGLVVTYNGLEGVKADYLSGSTLLIQDSSGFNANQISDNLGGGVVNAGADGVGRVDVYNCVIRDNHGILGGGITSNGATTVVKNCLIANNTTAGGGGAALGIDGVVSLVNCTMADNSASSGGGGVYLWSGELTVSNSILWGNTPEEIVGSVAVTYSDVQGGYAGAGNMNLDPVFSDPASHDYHLGAGSPCIDAGDPESQEPDDRDIDGHWRVWDGDEDGECRVDMGSDEFGSHCPGDLDGDDDIDLGDLAALLANYGTTSGMTPEDGDFDLDGDVDLSDLSALLAVYGTTCG